MTDFGESEQSEFQKETSFTNLQKCEHYTNSLTPRILTNSLVFIDLRSLDLSRNVVFQ